MQPIYFFNLFSFQFPNSDLPAFTPHVFTVYCCLCFVSVISLLHVSVYVGIDCRALSLNSFDVKHLLVSVLLLLLLLPNLLRVVKVKQRRFGPALITLTQDMRNL